MKNSKNNSSNRNNEMVNVNNTKNEIVKNESVENVENTANSIVVSSQYEDKRICRNRMYWGHSHNSQNRNRIVLVTNKEVSRGALMITYVVIELNHVVGYDENDNPICSYKLNQYRKSAKTYGNDDTGYWEIVEGANGVCGYDEITIEDIKKRSSWNYGVLPMDEDMYKKWGEWMNAMTSVYGLKAVLVGDDEDTVNEEQAKKDEIKKQIIDNVGRLTNGIVAVKWVVYGDLKGECITAEVGYDDDLSLVYRLHDNYFDHHRGLANKLFTNGPDLVRKLKLNNNEDELANITYWAIELRKK